MMPLPHEADSPISEFCERVASPRCQRFRIKVYCTVRWSVQRSKQMKQRTFSRTGWSDNRDHLALAQREIDTIQDRDRASTGDINFPQGTGFQANRARS